MRYLLRTTSLAAIVMVGAIKSALAVSLLPALTITTALSATGAPAFKFVQTPPRDVAVQANFVYGSGGTTVDAYLQTTFDNGLTWCDIANFHFTTSSAREAINLSSLTPVTTQHACTDGSMTANTAADGLLGSQLRVKYASTGTYAGTSLQIDVATTPLQSAP